jgi:UDP-glucose-4-epimerase GalE
MRNEAHILVSGGAGYIGSHTAKALSRAGYKPVVLDNLSSGHRGAVKWGPLVEGDCGDSRLVRAVIKEYAISAVIHFAASAYVGESVENPRKYYRNNCVNSLELLDAALAEGVACMVFSSSCATYGVPAALPIREDHAQCPVNPYGESKLFVEQALRSYHAAYGLNSIVLRYFNAAGADREAELREDHDPETHLIPLAVETAQGRRDALPVYGIDYATPDGTAIRDYVHVSDLAAAHVRALRRVLKTGGYTALNLGAGRGYSVLDVLRAVSRVTGASIPIRPCPRRAGDPPELVADVDLARRLLHWRPMYSDLDTIVSSALRAAIPADARGRAATAGVTAQ